MTAEISALEDSIRVGGLAEIKVQRIKVTPYALCPKP